MGIQSHGWSRERKHPYNRQCAGPRGSGPRAMGAQRGPPGTDLSGGPHVGPRHGNWEGRDGSCRVADGRPRRWEGEVRRQFQGRLESRELWGRSQTHPAMRRRLLRVKGQWCLGGLLDVALRRGVSGYHQVDWALWNTL